MDIKMTPSDDPAFGCVGVATEREDPNQPISVHGTSGNLEQGGRRGAGVGGLAGRHLILAPAIATIIATTRTVYE